MTILIVVILLIPFFVLALVSLIMIKHNAKEAEESLKRLEKEELETGLDLPISRAWLKSDLDRASARQRDWWFDNAAPHYEYRYTEKCYGGKESSEDSPVPDAFADYIENEMDDLE